MPRAATRIRGQIGGGVSEEVLRALDADPVVLSPGRTPPRSRRRRDACGKVQDRLRSRHRGLKCVPVEQGTRDRGGPGRMEGRGRGGGPGKGPNAVAAGDERGDRRHAERAGASGYERRSRHRSRPRARSGRRVACVGPLNDCEETTVRTTTTGLAATRLAVNILLAWFAFYNLTSGLWQFLAPRSFSTTSAGSAGSG